MTLEALPGAVPFAVSLFRVGPVVHLSPLLGGGQVPGVVRAGLTLAVAGWMAAARVVPPLPVALGLPQLLAEQLVVGGAIGISSAWALNAALAAGRWADVFRGASAEVMNPATGNRESALGELLYRGLLAATASSAGWPALAVGVARSMRTFPPGGSCAGSLTWETVLSGWSASFGAGLSVALPFAALALAVDVGVALVGRVVSSFPLGELPVPARLFLGAGMAYLVLGTATGRLAEVQFALVNLVGKG